MGVSEQRSGLGKIDHIVVLMLEDRVFTDLQHNMLAAEQHIRAQAGLPLGQP